MTDETFKKSWRGWNTSSEGYAVWVGSRTGIEYRDANGQIHIDSEAMSVGRLEVVVYVGSIPDTSERPRATVLGHLRRVFAFRGWLLTLEDA